MLCTFELNTILQNRTTFVKSLQGRTKYKARYPLPAPPPPRNTCLTYNLGLLNCGCASLSICCLYVLSKSRQHFACAYLYILLKTHALLYLTFLLVNQNEKNFLSHFCFVGPWVIWLVVLRYFYFCLRYKRGRQVLEEHFSVQNCRVIILRDCKIFP